MAYVDGKRDEALKNADSILSNPNATQEDLAAAQRFLDTADSWSEGGVNNRKALHVIGGGLIGWLGGRSIRGAAAGAAVHTRELADSVGGGLIGNLAGNAANVIASGIIGGAAGASTASSVNLYNQ